MYLPRLGVGSRLMETDEMEWGFESVLTTAKVLAWTSLLALDRAFVG